MNRNAFMHAGLSASERNRLAEIARMTSRTPTDAGRAAVDEWLKTYAQLKADRATDLIEALLPDDRGHRTRGVAPQDLRDRVTGWRITDEQRTAMDVAIEDLRVGEGRILRAALRMQWESWERTGRAQAETVRAMLSA